MKPKVSMVAPAYMPAEAFGGPVQAIAAIAKILVERGYGVRVFTTDVRDPFHPRSETPLLSHEHLDGVDVERERPVAFVAGYWVTPKLFSRLVSENSDLIFAHCARSFQLDIAALASFVLRKPLIVAPHGSVYSYGLFRGGLRRPLYVVHNAALKLVFKQAKRIVATSQEEVRQISRFGADMAKVVLIPNFVEESQFSRLPERGGLRQNYGLTGNVKIILFVGRMARVKGLETLLGAFSEVIKSRDDVWLVLVGPDGGYYKQMIDLSQRLRCSHRVITPGPLYGDKKLEAFVDSDIVVMPSDYESFGIVALEAFGCGKPVVGSRVGGLQELIIPDHTGLLFERGNIVELGSILKSLLDRPDFVDEMGGRARKFVFEKYSDRAIGWQVLTMCEQLGEATIAS